MKHKNTKSFRIIPHLPALKNFSSRTAWEQACWKNLVESNSLLLYITTASERHNIVMRAACLDALAQNKTYQDIGKELFLSPQTVSTVRHMLDDGYYESYAESVKTGKTKKGIKKHDANRERRPSKRYVKYPRI